MKKLLVGVLALVCFFTINSCKEVFETNLAKSTITILAPADTATLTSSNVTFWWNTVDGALKYNIQIVKPSFNNIQTLLIDSNVTTNKFTYTFNPGSYQWRIRALNGSSNTAYFTRSFKIDSSLNLTTSTVQLTSPANGFTTANFTVSLQWLALPAASTYNLEVQKTVPTVGNIVTTNGITAPSYSYVFPAYGTYQWRVSAENSNSNSQYSSWNIINISMPIPTSQAPHDRDTTQAGPSFVLTWSRGSIALNGEVAPAGDSIFVYADSTETTLAQVTGSQPNPMFVTTKSYTFTPTSPASKQWYSWKVKTIDSLSNQSSFTPIRRFRKST
ncbi:MAG TPA: hypothetical protein VNX01_07810 [Bacteroidia bacterium]|nr:hypothetical protein [Bacteroidia bacterium]